MIRFEEFMRERKYLLNIQSDESEACYDSNAGTLRV